MRFHIKTSLVALVFAVGVTDAFAAPAVRSLGTGTNTVSGTMANGATGGTVNNNNTNGTSARAGSMRSTGGYATRPTVSTSNPVSGGTAGQATTTGSSVSSGGASLGRSSSTPRLAIGKYIGAPRSISTDGQDVTSLVERVEALESTTERLDSEKQDNLSGTEFITVDGNEVFLEFDHLREALGVHDGREVELTKLDDGLAWKYSDETEWRMLVSWDDLKSELDITNIDESVTNMNTQITSIVNDITRIEADLESKLDKNQGSDNEGKVLIVGTGGVVMPSEVDVSGLTGDVSGKVDKDQGTGAAGHVLSVNSSGFVTNTEQVYFKDEMDTKLANKLDAKVADPTAYAGKAMVVDGETGEIKPTGTFVNLDQGTVNGNRVLTVDETTGLVRPGKIVYSTSETDDLLSAKLGNTVDAVEYGNMAMVVDDVTGEIKPTGDFVQRSQPGKEGKALIVGDDGFVTTGSINTSSLGLGELAYEDIVTNDLVANRTLKRAKLAGDIVDTLNWIDAWRESMPEEDGSTRYVLAIDEYGGKSWFKVE